MKNVINYYYNILFDDIHQTNQDFYFDINDSRYFFILFEGDISSLQNTYKLQEELLQRNLYVHQILLNKDGQIVTFVNGNPYILLKALYYSEKINFKYVISFSQIIMNPKESYDWKILWSEKNDHLEYQINQTKNRYPLINESFNYFIGLGETSIELLNEIKKQNIPQTIAHRRINSNNTIFELYNPLNLIIDTRTRDVAEYFKSKFFNTGNIDKDLEDILKEARLATAEYYLFFARMLYPTYYFDLYEEIISGKKDEKEIKKITDKINDYEKILKKIYSYYKNFLPLTSIEWLETN